MDFTLSRTASGLALAALLSACATPTAPAPDGPEQATNQNDCAVIAAVAKGHYEFDRPGNTPPPLWLFSENGDWSPRCDWSRYGLSFPATFDPNASRTPGERVQYVQFQKPVYTGSGATIEAGIVHGPLAGMGVRCQVVSGVAGWMMTGQCQNTWIS